MDSENITPKDRSAKNNNIKNIEKNDNEQSIIFKNAKLSPECIEISGKNNEFIKIVLRTPEEISTKNSDFYEIIIDNLNKFKEIILIFDFQILSIQLDIEEAYKLINKILENKSKDIKFSLIIKNSYINPDKDIIPIEFNNNFILNKLEIHDELYSLSINLNKLFPNVKANELILKKFKFNSKSQLEEFCNFIISTECKILTLEDIYIDLIIKKNENDEEYKDLDIYFSYMDGIIALNNYHTDINSLKLRDCPLFAIIGEIFTQKNNQNYKDIDIDETSLINPSIITKFKIKDGKYEIWFDLDSYKLQLEENEDFKDDYDFIDYLDYIFNIIIGFTRKDQKIKINEDDDGIGKINREYFKKLVFKNFDITKFEYITDDDITFIEEKNWVLNNEEKERKEKWEKLEKDLNNFEYKILSNVEELVFDNCSNFFIKWILNFTKGKIYEKRSKNYDFELLKIKKCGKDYVDISKILLMTINKVILFDTPLIIGNNFPKNKCHLDNIGKNLNLGSINNLIIKINSLDTYGREYNLQTYKTYEILIELIKNNKFNKNLTFELNALSNIMTFLAFIKYLDKQGFYNNPNEEEEGKDKIKEDDIKGVVDYKDIINNDEKFLPQNIFFSSKMKRDKLYYDSFDLKVFDMKSKITLNNLTIKKTTENYDNQNYLLTKINKANNTNITANNQLKKINFGSDGFYIDRDYKNFFSINNIGNIELTNVVCSNYKDNTLKNIEQETIISLLSDNNDEQNSIKENNYKKTHFPNYIMDVKTLNGILYKNFLYEDVGILFRFFMYKVDPPNIDYTQVYSISSDVYDKKKSLNYYFLTFKKIFETIEKNIKLFTVVINTIKELKEFYCTMCLLKVLMKEWKKEKFFVDNRKDKTIEIEMPDKTAIEEEIKKYFLQEKNEEEKNVYAEMNYYYTSNGERDMIKNKMIKIDGYVYNIQCNVNFEEEI